MKKLITIAALLATTLGFSQCKEVTIASNIAEFYKIDIKGNTLQLTHNQAGTISLFVAKGEAILIELEGGESLELEAKETTKTIFTGSGDLSRSLIIPSYIIEDKDLALLSSFQVEGITFKGVKTIIKNKRRKAKLMSLAACNIK
jgi:hypothetical protein